MNRVALAASLAFLLIFSAGRTVAGTLGVGTAVVVDSNHNWVGPYTSSSGDAALRKINGLWFALPVGPLGGGFTQTGVPLQYPTTDCTGIGYLNFAIPNIVASERTNGAVSIANNILYYQNQTTPLNITALSSGGLKPDGTPLLCNSGSEGVVAVAVPLTFDLSTLNFSPPFTIKVVGMK